MNPNAYFVKVYFKCLRTHDFIARDMENAMEIAGRIIQEGCWISDHETGDQELFPPSEVFKVKIHYGDPR
jgi:hypothetical protein